MGYRVKCIALDLDRTTLDSSGHLPEENRQAIQEALTSGILVVVASGRPFSALPEEIRQLPGLTYAITGNGCAICRLPDGKRLQAFCLGEEALNALLPYCRSGVYGLECFIDGKAYAEKGFWENPLKYGATEKGAPYIQRTRTPVENMEEFLMANAACLDAVDLVCPRDEQRLLLQEQLRQAVPGIYVTSSIERLLEISSAESGKHRAVKRLLDKYGILPEEAAAFGDGDNDAEMLAFVGYGIAMANATEKCRQAASYHTLSNDEAGVAKAIRTILWEE